MIKVSYILNFIILFLLRNSSTLNQCMPQDKVNSIVDFVKSYHNTSTNYTILNLEQNLSSIYKLIPKIGKYKVQIQDQYQINVASSIEDYQISQNVIDERVFNGTIGYNSQQNIWLKFSQGLVTITCSLAWKLKISCGTFVEIHFPYEQQALVKEQIEDLSNVINFAIEHLCAGPYHLWLIYSTRTGQFIKAVYPLFVSYPFCSC